MKSKVHKLLLIIIDIIVILSTYYISVLANELLLKVVDNLYLTKFYIFLPIQIFTLALGMCYQTSKPRSIIGDSISVVISNLAVFVVAVGLYELDMFDCYVYLISNLVFQTLLISVLHQIVSDLSTQRNKKSMMVDSYSTENFRTQKTVEYKKALELATSQNIDDVVTYINSNEDTLPIKLDDDVLFLDDEFSYDQKVLDEMIDEPLDEIQDDDDVLNFFLDEDTSFTLLKDGALDFLEEESKQLSIKQPTETTTGDIPTECSNSDEFDIAINDNNTRQEEMVKQVKNEKINELDFLLNKLRNNQEVIFHKKNENSSLPKAMDSLDKLPIKEETIEANLDNLPPKEETMQDKLARLNDMFKEFSAEYLSMCEDNPDVAKQQLFNLLGTLEPELLENATKPQEKNETTPKAKSYKYHLDNSPKYLGSAKYSSPIGSDFLTIENSYRDNLSDKTPLYDSSEYYDAYTKHLVGNSQNNEKEIFYDIDDFNVSDIIMNPNFEIKIKKAKTEKTRQEEKENLERLLRKSRENQGKKVRTSKAKSKSLERSKPKEQAPLISPVEEKEPLTPIALNKENLNSKPVKNSDDMTMRINNEPQENKKMLKKSSTLPKAEESKPIDLETFEHLDEPIQNHIDISDVYDESATLENLLASVLQEIGNVEQRIAKLDSSYEGDSLISDEVVQSVEKGEVIDIEQMYDENVNDVFESDDIDALIDEITPQEVTSQTLDDVQPINTEEDEKKKANENSNRYLSDDDLDFISDLLDSL